MFDFNVLGDIARAAFKANDYPHHLNIYERIYDRNNGKYYVDILDKEKTIAHMQITMQRGWEAKIQPITALHNIVWYNGRPCLYGDAAWARVVGHSEYAGHEETEKGFVLKRKGQSKKPDECVRKFTEEDAAKAGLLKLDHYQKYLERMLMIRSRTWAMRDLFPDVLHGFSIAEEQKEVQELAKIKESEVDYNEPPLDDFTQKALEQKGLYGTSPAAAVIGQIKTANDVLLAQKLHGENLAKELSQIVDTKPGAINYVDELKMPGFDLDCIQCGTKFRSKTERRKFCSDKCKGQYHYTKKKEKEE